MITCPEIWGLAAETTFTSTIVSTVARSRGSFPCRPQGWKPRRESDLLSQSVGDTSLLRRPRPAEAVGVGRPASAPSRGESAMFRVTHKGEGLDDADTIDRHRQLTDRPMHRNDALRMIKHRAKAAGFPEEVCCHTFRATGITAYLENGGTIEHANRLRITKAQRPRSFTTAPAIRSRSTKWRRLRFAASKLLARRTTGSHAKRLRRTTSFPRSISKP
jgi:hypothetical protein